MAETVQVEWRKAGRSVNAVVDRKFRHRERRAPRRRRRRAEAAEDILDDAIRALCLTVGLRMILGRHVKLGDASASGLTAWLG